MSLPKINKFVISLLKKTEAGEYTWSYDDSRPSVTLDTKEFEMMIVYSFNSIEEIGQFVIFYTEKPSSVEYRFSTDQQWDDYNTVLRLFDIAQASKLKLPF